MWGLSLDNNLRPKVEALGNICHLTMNDVGELVARAPEILLLSWAGNLEPTLQFLRERLQLSSIQLSAIVRSTPRVLVQSIHKSLESKIALLEEYSSHHGKDGVESVTDIILERPALLITSKSQLIKRLQKHSKGEQLRKKTIVQLSMDGEAISEFSTVAQAAEMAETSTSNMYNVIREGRVFREMKYVYGSRSSSDSPSLAGKKQATGAKQRIRIQKRLPEKTKDDSCLSLYVSGCAWPSDGALQNRGLRKAGGMAIFIPNLPEGLSEDLLSSALDECCRGQILATRKSGNRADDLLVLLGYTNLRPSRRRASLHICLVTLRVLAQVYRLADKKAAAAVSRQSGGDADIRTLPVPTTIRIVTDSNYVHELLQSTEKLLQWGSKPTLAEFVYTGRGSDWAANPDILYSLSRSYSGLLDLVGQKLSRTQANLTVSFVHVGEGMDHVSASTLRDNMGDWAAEAAKWQYKRSFVRERRS